MLWSSRKQTIPVPRHDAAVISPSNSPSLRLHLPTAHCGATFPSLFPPATSPLGSTVRTSDQRRPQIFARPSPFPLLLLLLFDRPLSLSLIYVCTVLLRSLLNPPPQIPGGPGSSSSSIISLCKYVVDAHVCRKKKSKRPSLQDSDLLNPAAATSRSGTSSPQSLSGNFTPTHVSFTCGAQLRSRKG